MNTDFTIKNFRIFDKEGVTVDLRPLTILTGCNNSGKSSIVKALCLLKDFCKQIEEDYKARKKKTVGFSLHVDMSEYMIDFHKYPNSLLGSFNNILHQTQVEQDALDEESKLITFQVVAKSHFLLDYVKVNLTFSAKDVDDLNNAFLYSVEIRTMDEKLIYSCNFTAKDNKIKCDFTHVKKNLLHFLYLQRAMFMWNKENHEYAICEKELNENYGEDVDKMVEMTYQEFGGRGLIWTAEWVISNGGLYGNGTGSSILKNTENTEDNITNGKEDIPRSFYDAPALEVYTYFPFMSELKDYDKQKICDVIENLLLEKKDEKIVKCNQRSIQLTLAAFKDSDATTFHEFVSDCENIFFKGVSRPYFCISREKFDWHHLLIALFCINWLMEDEKRFIYADPFGEGFYSLNSIESLIELVLEDIYFQLLPGEFIYGSTKVTNLKRLYSLEENEEFVETLRDYFGIKRKRGIGEKPVFLNKWLNELGIAHHTEMKLTEDGYGLTIRLFRDEEDKKGMMLADKGYGTVQIFGMLLKIQTAIMKKPRDEDKILIRAMFSLSETLIDATPSRSQLYPVTVALEEPENHLHPSIQSKLADIIVDAYKNYGIHFTVESHSEYFIRKLQLLVSQKEVEADKVSLLYVNSQDRPDYEPLIKDIGIDEDGTLKNEFGEGFFDESYTLSKKLLRAKTV